MISAFKSGKAACLHTKQRYSVTVHSNQPVRLFELINGRERKYDYNPQNYDVTIQALLQKRWTKKQEIRKYE